jgi:hypothetical protein
LRHLSQFEDHLFRGRFDKGRLDSAIADVDEVARHNPLDDRARQILFADLNELRTYRATQGYLYR